MAAVGVAGRGGPGLVRTPLGWVLGLSLLLGLGAPPGAATTHWVVTEDGKIQQQIYNTYAIDFRQYHLRFMEYFLHQEFTQSSMDLEAYYNSP